MSEPASRSDTEHPGQSLPRILDVAVCCAQADFEAVLGVFPGLVGIGVSPRIVAGIEADPEMLVEALTRATTPTLFVVCVSAELPSASVRRLVELFSRKRAPLQRLLVAELNPGRAYALIAAVRSATDGWRRHLGAARGQASLGGRESIPVDAVQGDHRVERVLVPTAMARPSAPVILGEGIPAVRAVKGVERAARPALRLLPPVTGDPPAGGPASVVADSTAATAVRSGPARIDPAALSASDWQHKLGQAAPAIALRRRFASPLLLGVSVFAGAVVALAAGFVAGELGSASAQPGRVHVGVAEATATAVGPLYARDVVRSPVSVGARTSVRSGAARRPAAQVREVANLHVVRASDVAVTWADAAARCRERGPLWRLPSTAEIRWVHRAGLLAAGASWTIGRAKASAEPSNWVLDAGELRGKPKSATAFAVCVHPQ